ncbi:MAG: glycosyltransferase family 2 protein, partial [Bacteroidota bacterium]
MKEELVSIIMPFRNTAEFLPECLDSILQQSYPNWELIAINDRSEDNSLDILETYAHSDSRISVNHNRGQGILPALQTGYEKVQGTFITRMDSDDVMATHRLQWMVAKLTEKGTDHLAVGQVKYFSHRGISDGYQKYECWLNQLTAKGTNYEELYKECVVPSPCWMVHRSDFEKCGGFSHNRYPEDYDLTFRFYENGLKVIPCDQVLLHWRDYDTRTSRTSEHYAQNYFLDIKMHYFLKLHFDEQKTLVVWGAGFKGKTIAKTLVDQNIDFVWLCDNPNKIGKRIYGKKLSHFDALKDIKRPQSIITVANAQAQIEIRGYLAHHGFEN